jgi:hypothetical protein
MDELNLDHADAIDSMRRRMVDHPVFTAIHDIRSLRLCGGCRAGPEVALRGRARGWRRGAPAIRAARPEAQLTQEVLGQPNTRNRKLPFHLRPLQERLQKRP